jgi:HemX protein
MSSALLAAVTLALYIAAGVCYGAVLFLDAPSAPSHGNRKAAAPRLARLGRPLLILGIAVHIAVIGVLCVHTHRSPFASEYGTLAVSAWAIALAYAVLDFRIKLPALGAVALLAACLMQFWGLVHARGPVAETPLLSQRIVSLHVLATVGSLALFALAGGCAGLYILQNRLLKAHDGKGMFRRLPALATLDSLAYHSVAFGLPLLTLGLSLGILYVYRSGMPAQAWWADPKTIVSFVVWFLYIVYLAARLAAGWRGVRLQYILLAGLLIAPALYAIPGPTHQFH